MFKGMLLTLILTEVAERCGLD